MPPDDPKPKKPVFLVHPEELKDPAARREFVKAMAGDIIAIVNEKRKSNGLPPVTE
jgi:hypothetical protein